MANQTRSPRERPAKRALSREWIVEETLRILRTEGLEKVTMRRVAQALETGPASLYVYVANTAELHAAVLDELLASLDARAAGDWRRRVERLLGQYSEVLFAHPGLARSALVLRPAGPNAVRLYDLLLGLLLEGGMQAGQAAWGVDLLLQHVTATAAEHSAPTPSEVHAPADEDGGLEALSAALRRADPSVTPHVAAHADALMCGVPAQRDRWAITALLAGIAATAIPSG